MKILRISVSWCVVLAGIFIAACFGCKAYAESSSVTLEKYCDAWHYSGGYWIIGNYGTNKYKVTDREMAQTGFGGVMGSEKMVFNFSLPTDVAAAMSEGKSVTAKAAGVSATLGSLFDEDSVSIQLSADGCSFSAYPKFNIIPEVELSFADYDLAISVFVPLIDNAYGDNIYSIYGNGIAGGQATGWLAVGSPYGLAGMPAGRLHPSQIEDLSGALKSGSYITIAGKSQATGGLSVGKGTFAAGGAVGLSFQFSVKITFQIEGEGDSSSGSAESASEPADSTPTATPTSPRIAAWLFGTQKQNRLQGINADVLSSGSSPYWYATMLIENLSTGESVSIYEGFYNKTSQNIKIRYFREQIDLLGEPYLSCVFVTKYTEPVQLRYTLTVINEEELQTTYSESFWVQPDQAPVCSITMESPIYITAAEAAASFQAFAAASSPDGDKLSYAWDLSGTKYSYIQNYNKSAISFSITGVRALPVKLTVTEQWSQQTIDKYVSESDYLSASCTVYAKVILSENTLRIHRLF